MNARLACLGLMLAASPPLPADEVAPLLDTIRAVGKEAVGADAARAARDKLVALGAAAVPGLLAALDTPNPVAAHWLVSALNAIVDREIKSGGTGLDADLLVARFADTQRGGMQRRYAMQVLDRIAPEKPKTLILDMLNDAEFRRDAVEAVYAQAEAARRSGKPADARRLFEAAFESARDPDQVQRTAGRLRSYQITKDVPAHLGFLTDWYVIGPWPATNRSGFALALPPEASPGAADLKASHPGDKNPLTWKRHKTPDALGVVNMLTAIGQRDEAVGYAWTTVEAPREMQVEFRGAGNDTITVWLNGGKIIADDEYLERRKYDRNIARVRLRRGTNTVLVKNCQGPFLQGRDANRWEFQLRICDATGKGVGVATSLPPEQVAEATP